MSHATGFLPSLGFWSIVQVLSGVIAVSLAIGFLSSLVFWSIATARVFFTDESDPNGCLSLTLNKRSAETHSVS